MNGVPRWLPYFCKNCSQRYDQKNKLIFCDDCAKNKKIHYCDKCKANLLSSGGSYEECDNSCNTIICRCCKEFYFDKNINIFVGHDPHCGNDGSSCDGTMSD